MSKYRTSDLQTFALMFRALANPRRLAVFLKLAGCCGVEAQPCCSGEMRACVGELGKEMGVAPATVSHHIKELRQAGLVRMERRGQAIECWVEPEIVAALARFFCGAESTVAPGGETMSDKDQETRARERDDIRRAVREMYGDLAAKPSASCGCHPISPCCGDEMPSPESRSVTVGYREEDLGRVPAGADLGVGCGNPVALSGLQAGETVLDLGSGGGLDCFLAAERVGTKGRVIGVDMTPEMVARARESARKGDYANVEFRLGEIEHLPVADGSVDVLISNCVINLSPDKRSVWREAFRVLRPGGRMVASDMVARKAMSAEMRRDRALWAACVSGAETAETLERELREAGFSDIRIRPREGGESAMVPAGRGSPAGGSSSAPDHVFPATIEAVKPLPIGG